MNPQTLPDIMADIASAPGRRVLYVEGKNDAPTLFGLLGISQPSTPGLFIHQGTLVKQVSGRNNLEQRISAAKANGLAGNVFGIVDGDGDDIASLRARFDSPFAGPLFAWKSYCVEGLFPQCPWNPAWGPQPAWQAELAVYAPYAALYCVHMALRGLGTALDLGSKINPADPLRTVAQEKARLAAGKHRFVGFDPEAAFDAEVARFKAALASSTEEALALMDGKWLFTHFLTARFGLGAAAWRSRWIAQITAAGGLPEVRDLWQRMTGSAP